MEHGAGHRAGGPGKGEDEGRAIGPRGAGDGDREQEEGDQAAIDEVFPAQKADFVLVGVGPVEERTPGVVAPAGEIARLPGIQIDA